MDEKIKIEINRCLNCKTKPCQKGCPLSNDIPKVIELIKEEKYVEAYNKLTETTVLPAICGNVCPHSKQCQENCTRGKLDEPIKIGEIEEWLGKLAIEKKWSLNTNANTKRGKYKVAVIGGGPAGLTCAAFLAKSGVDVTIFEKHSFLGGILEHGIPSFRLDKKIVSETIENIKKIENSEIEVKYNIEIGKDITLGKLKKDYDIIFLAFGANISQKMNIEGEDLPGVYGANEFLENENDINFANKNITIIGGGDVAIDMARTAKKNGARSVKIIYRRSEKEMPAELKQIISAKEDFIEFLFKTNVIKIIENSDNKTVQKLECVKTKLVAKEGESRLVPVNIEATNFFIDTDIVFMAVGSKTDESIIDILNLKLNKKKYIAVDEKHQTSDKQVFAGGDLIGEKNTVAWASRSGRDSAESILNYLKNNK